MPPVIPYTKQTWVDGSGGATPISAARLGVVEEGILDVSRAPAVHVYHSAAQSIPNATFTALSFDSERFDTAAGAAATHHDTVTNNGRLTCLYAGKYQITANIEFATSGAGSGIRVVELSLLGATAIARTGIAITTAAVTPVLTVTTLYDLAVNDWITVRVLHDTGGALNVNASGNYSPEFMMVRVG